MMKNSDSGKEVIAVTVVSVFGQKLLRQMIPCSRRALTEA